MHLPRRFIVCVALLLSCVRLPAFNGQVVTEGPLTLTIAPIALVTEFDATQRCDVALANSGATPLEVALELNGLVDDCRAVGVPSQQLTVPPRGSASVRFHFTCGRGTHSAHYPVHVHARFAEPGAVRALHAVQVFQTRFPVVSPPLADGEPPVTPVPARGALALAGVKTQQLAWSYLAGGERVRQPVGWTGTDPVSATTFTRGPITRNGVSRTALQMHPPYRPRAGTAFAEYRLQLPATTPLRLAFFNAIRDHAPTEPASDGVTFRVWADDQQLFERHTDAKAWTAGEVDLSAFAGKEIRLRLESHPGPRNNTACDSSYWGDPVITVGPPARIATDTEREALAARARALLGSGPLPRGGEGANWTFELEGGCRAAVVLGPNGLADGVIGFGDHERRLIFAGLHLALEDHLLGTWPSAAVVRQVEVRPAGAGRTRIDHRVELGGREAMLGATIWAEGPALRIKVESAARISGLGVNPADQRAARVYYGHGYCIVEPQAFRAGAGGHNLSTSHVGFDFEQGVSLLMASDTPPDHLQVDPDRRIYQLHTHPDATLTFVPGRRGALDCAVRYRPLFDRPAAPGVRHKAGRFVFDLWGGRYAENAARLAQAFDYGLTDALVMIHTWQRWGYDYRLPDIFPPQPALGTLAELQELGRLCTSRGVLWGLHDNYIDLYPDATGFSYDHVTFTPDGQPRRAWLNEGREAQSYQFRPDRFQPFLQRNLALIVPALRPTSSFVDVFASAPTFDFYDRQGNFHSKRETQRAWGEAFVAIREACGNDAPTVSEAGGDYLIGWLDGSDAQFMLLGPKPERFHNVVGCRDWARVPWFDAVNHARFSLHGVGYSDRYQGGRSREEHGIESDDYLSAEMLTGHALMIDRAAMGRGAVRKYWLAQDFIASIARDDIREVEFAEGDIHRLVITWNSGARVHVNRGASDWTVAGRTLPQYGFLAQNGPIESSVERIGGTIAERSHAPGRHYFNSRVFNPGAPLAITPAAERVEYLGGRQFRLHVEWDAQRAAPKDCTVFYHFSRPTPGRRALTEFFGGGRPAVPTSAWQGRVTTGAGWTIAVPADMPMGEYEILVGLHDPRNAGQRERLLGDEDPRRRYRVGKLVVSGSRAGEITDIRLQRPERPPATLARVSAPVEHVDFGPTKTAGAFRCEIAGEQVVVTPLPDGPDFEVHLRLGRLLGRAVRVRAVEAIDARGTARGAVGFRLEGDELSFGAEKRAFAYRVKID